MSYYQMHRGWMDNDVFGNEPYTKAQAWEWMIGEANWKDSIKLVLGNPVMIKRGQFPASIRFMAEKFQWSNNKVIRFIDGLKGVGMVNTDVNTGQFIITICNYSKYQDNKNIADTESETLSNTESNTDTNTNKKKIINKEKNIYQKPEDISEQTWNDFQALRKSKKAPVTESAIAGIRKEAAKAGYTIEQALTECCVRGWQSFKSDWVEKKPEKRGYKMPSPAGG